MADLVTDLRCALDPVAFATEALSLQPDPWQQRVLRSSSPRLMMACSRQAGKSTIASVLALHRALFYPKSLVLLLSPSLRQSSELFRKVLERLEAMKVAPHRAEDNRLSLTFDNGSRIVSLPSSEATVRGFSGVSLIIEDEAGFVPDELYAAVRPMLAVSRGRLVLMSTPNGKRGHFFLEWTSDSDAWERIQITAQEVPRISPEFLEEERRSLGEWRYRQEYECQFVESADQLFRYEDVLRATEPPSPTSRRLAEPARRLVVGLDLGQARDPTAFVAIEPVLMMPQAEEVAVAGKRKRVSAITNQPPEPPPPPKIVYRVLQCRRLPLGMPYTRIVESVAELLRSFDEQVTLVVDATGVGRAVVDLFASRGIYPVAITTTGGARVTDSGQELCVPKRDLVTTIEILLQEGQLKIAQGAGDSSALVDELLSFQANISDSGRETFAARGSTHDDLVMALGLGLWWARRSGGKLTGFPVHGISESGIPDDSVSDWLGDPGNMYPRGYASGPARSTSFSYGMARSVSYRVLAPRIR